MTWEADSQLVRGTPDGHYNLAIGDPVFLREQMTGYYPLSYTDDLDLGYPDTVPAPRLMEQLQKLHPDQEIVVTCGAKQALHAAVYALDKRPESFLYHRAPHWPSYASLAGLQNLWFTHVADNLHLLCNTTPNNPDGTEDHDPCDIFDAAYAASVYGWSGKAPPHRISVWSAGKLLGAPGVRVGWLCTKEPQLAARARQYVEQTTSGVPTTSQYHVADTLAALGGFEWREVVYKKARQTLDHNAQTFMKLSPHLDTVSGYPMNGRGMFAWFRVKDETRFQSALTQAKVLLVGGKACGVTDPGWYRLSLGQSIGYTAAAVDALCKALEKE